MHAEAYQTAQPTVYADWPDHLVEIPSFLHEALLTRYLLSEWADDDRERAWVLETVLDKLPLRTGAHWSAFVRRAHAVVEDGDRLTPGRLDEIYGDLQAEFLAPVDLRPEDRTRWLRQDLSRRPYFSYLYLLGMCGALAVDRRLAEGSLSPETYRSFLRAGSSDYPTALLDRIGLDFASGEPVARALSTYGDYVDELAAAVDG